MLSRRMFVRARAKNIRMTKLSLWRERFYFVLGSETSSTVSLLAEEKKLLEKHETALELRTLNPNFVRNHIGFRKKQQEW